MPVLTGTVPAVDGAGGSIFHKGGQESIIGTSHYSTSLGKFALGCWKGSVPLSLILILGFHGWDLEAQLGLGT